MTRERTTCLRKSCSWRKTYWSD